jgi:hypothetical protein
MTIYMPYTSRFCGAYLEAFQQCRHRPKPDLQNLMVQETPEAMSGKTYFLLKL